MDSQSCFNLLSSDDLVLQDTYKIFIGHLCFLLSLIANDVKHFYQVLIGHLYFSLESCLFSSLAHLFMMILGGGVAFDSSINVYLDVMTCLVFS